MERTGSTPSSAKPSQPGSGAERPCYSIPDVRYFYSTCLDEVLKSIDRGKLGTLLDLLDLSSTVPLTNGSRL